MNKKKQKIKYNSPVILTYTIISFIVVLLGYITDNNYTKKFFMIYFSSIKDPMLYMRIFTHVIGQIDFNHFFNNFIIILLIGPLLEEKYGSRCILISIIFTAFITGIIHILFCNTALLGASGVVFMFIILSSFTNYKKGTIPITLILIIVIFIGRELVNEIMVKDNISRITHIVGGILGAFIGFILDNNDKKKFNNIKN